MNITIVICTRNRAESLRLTLESIGRATIPPGWTAELLVIDNGSTDHTAAVVRAARFGNAAVRYVNEPAAGHSRARNTGLKEASGQIILCTDDDVRVPANWIEGMGRSIFEGEADAVAGGVAFPPGIASALARPPFSSRRSWFGSTEELRREGTMRMVGANMAFHRRVLDRVRGFDLELGPGALGFHEETLFSWQLIAAGYRLVSAFDIVVEHHFDPTRLSPPGMIDLARKLGRSQAFVFHHWEQKKSQLALPRLILSHLQRQWIRCCDRLRAC